jgi:quinol monooxygenase YgiN
VNIKELKEYTKKEKFIVFFGPFGYELYVDEENNKEFIFISSFYSHRDIIDEYKTFRNTKSAIKYIKKELKEAFKSTLKDIKECK